MNTMYFKGVSNLTHGVVIKEYPPVPAPSERGEWETVLGKEGEVWRGDGVNEQAPLPVVIYVKPTADLAAVRNWLTGAGELRFGVWSWTMQARVSAAIAFAPAPYNDGWNATITFSVTPAWYKYPAGANITLTASGTITNLGKVAAYPLITVNGTGDINLLVGSRTVLIDALDGAVTIDCEALMTSDPVTPVDDLWPILTYPTCAVSWTGTVSSVVITPRWREA